MSNRTATSRNNLPQYLELDTTQNADWHARHKLPPNPALEQRLKWHIEHARRCPCSLDDDDIRGELMNRYLGKHQDFWIDHNINDHRRLGLWAALCVERILPYFEAGYPHDPRPGDALITLRQWAQTGEFHMPVIRAASLGAHAAAKTVDRADIAAGYVAHAAGQAVGTAHVPTHALGAVLYSMRWVAETHPANVKTAVTRERAWQMDHLPDGLKPWVEQWLERIFPSLPKNLRSHLFVPPVPVRGLSL
jgi:hypothetical protein